MQHVTSMAAWQSRQYLVKTCRTICTSSPFADSHFPTHVSLTPGQPGACASRMGVGLGGDSPPKEGGRANSDKRARSACEVCCAWLRHVGCNAQHPNRLLLGESGAVGEATCSAQRPATTFRQTKHPSHAGAGATHPSFVRSTQKDRSSSDKIQREQRPPLIQTCCPVRHIYAAQRKHPPQMRVVYSFA